MTKYEREVTRNVVSTMGLLLNKIDNLSSSYIRTFEYNDLKTAADDAFDKLLVMIEVSNIRKK